MEKSRLLSLYQAYNKMYHETVRPIIDKEWVKSQQLQCKTGKNTTEKDKMGKNKSKGLPTVSISFRNATLKRMFNAEGPEKKEEVNTWWQAHQAADIDKEADPDADNRTQRERT